MRRTFLRVLAALSLALAFSISLPAERSAAQSGYIVAQVNEDIITNVDLEQRIKLLQFGAGRQIPNARQKALDALIADILKTQEAKRLGVKLEAKEVADAIALVARNNRVGPNDLIRSLTRAGVQRSAFEQQLRAELIWNKVIRGRYGARVKPTEGEIETALANAVSTKDIFDLRQMVLPLPRNATAAQVAAARKQMTSIRGRLKRCGDVPRVAKKEKLIQTDGKMPLEKLPGPLRSIISALGPNELSEPLASPRGVFLFMVCGVERKGVANRKRIEAQVRQRKLKRISDSYVSELKRSALITQGQ